MESSYTKEDFEKFLKVVFHIDMDHYHLEPIEEYIETKEHGIISVKIYQRVYHGKHKEKDDNN